MHYYRLKQNGMRKGSRNNLYIKEKKTNLARNLRRRLFSALKKTNFHSEYSFQLYNKKTNEKRILIHEFLE